MADALLKTPLHDWHAAHGGRMVEFGGWSMPVQYTTIVKEHLATRDVCGVFDISHMGRLRFDGAAAVKLLDSLLTRRVDTIPLGRIRYSLMTNDAGGVLDDVLIYRLQELDGTDYCLLVVNAGNRQKIVDWITPHLNTVAQVFMTDLTQQTGMIAVQGPAALKIAGHLTDVDLPAMKYYSAVHGQCAGAKALISRTGYTGEDGIELIVPEGDVVSVWEAILSAGADAQAVPVGLGARDTLRLEAAMPLYGHELTEDITPYQAGLDFAVDLEGRMFPGRNALAAVRNDVSLPRRVGLESSSGRVPREGCPVLRGGEQVGQVTSGTFSPTLDAPIAMAYVAPGAEAVGSEVIVDIRGRPQSARVVQLPFYTRK
jgi:aminomethyltransferase